ncbi:hypothetical protein DLAC_01460 [Tieghemostelium lacteum]|uniref:FAM50A/XAP5 C-terminal domain-containing protein n=1 Tax=Tieghemostelium lacteum TaxID=361077 RepID=A0A152A5G2_TIELA|nr:hypothetical protein DLAC_01460 [Tieghemostelium lacteum]|eukprot:KYR01473.1 hypothetical protein DLAC_01460 [Tieghemostelium lacteum]
MADTNRIRILEKQRENDLKELNKKKEKIKEDFKQSLVSINDKFQSTNSYTSNEFQTIGLVSVDDYNKNIKTKTAIDFEKKRKLEDIEKNKNKPKKPQLKKNKLSFDVDEDEEEHDEIVYKQDKKVKVTEKTTDTDVNSNGNGEKKSNGENNEIVDHKDILKQNKKKEVYFGKDPSINTEFLPDAERDEQERFERERLTKVWKEEQERIKNETIEITYSYWDGSGHRRTLTCTKGTTIEKFLEQVRKEFKELRGVTVDHLLFVKEDIIMPHEYSFYDFILTKAKGKSGPLFQFDVHEDIRLLNDASVQKDETHAAKVVEKGWYERNKHIFPASRWVPYDPTVQYDKYTISDKLVSSK